MIKFRKLKLILFEILIVSTFLGGVNLNLGSDVGPIRLVRIAIFLLVFLVSLLILLQENRCVILDYAKVYTLFIIYSAVTILWAPEKLFAAWKVFEITTILMVFLINQNQKSQVILYLRFYQLIEVFIYGVLITGLIFPHKGFIPIAGSLLPYSLHGSIYTMNSNDLGFWSGLVFTLTLLRKPKISFRLIILGIIIILSQSRSYILLTFFVSMYIMIKARRGLIPYFIVLGLIMIILVFRNQVEMLITRGNINQIQNLHGRTYYWALGYSYFRKHWLIGNGFYTGHRFLYQIFPNSDFSASTFDSTWIDILVDLGIVGGILMLSYLLLIFKYIKKLKKSPIKTELLIGFLFLLIRSLTGPSFESFGLFLILLLLTGYMANNLSRNHYINKSFF